MMLRASLFRSGAAYADHIALNDVVVTKGARSRMIDLSVGQLMGLIVVASCSLMEGRPEATIPAILLALAIGLTVGAINGFLNNRLRIHSLILTLGMLSILQGRSSSIPTAASGPPRPQCCASATARCA